MIHRGAGDDDSKRYYNYFTILSLLYLVNVKIFDECIENETHKLLKLEISLFNL